MHHRGGHGHRGSLGDASIHQTTGLSAKEAATRLAAEGPNELDRDERKRLPRIIRDILSEPIFGLLIAAGVIYLLPGDRVEALLLLAFASLSVTIAVVQETRRELVLDALRDLTSPRALVVRDGERCPHSRTRSRTWRTAMWSR